MLCYRGRRGGFLFRHPGSDTKICPASPNLRLVEACPETCPEIQVRGMQAQRQRFTGSHDLFHYCFLAWPLDPCEIACLAQATVLPPRLTQQSRLPGPDIFGSEHPSWCS